LNINKCLTGISWSFKTESDNSQKNCSLYENPISTVWVFIVLGLILRYDYLQFCLSTAKIYHPLSQSIADSNYQASFSIGRNRSLKLTLHDRCTAHVGASFS